MVVREVTYWDKPGKEHTEATLKIALNAAKEREIDTVLISSTTGFTAEAAVPLFKDSGLKVVVVTHATGYREKGVQMMKDETRKKLKKEGFKVVTCTDVLTGAVGLQLTYGVTQTGNRHMHRRLDRCGWSRSR